MSAGKRLWPNLILLGAAKAGTTTLYHALRAHPDIFMSPVKEPHFFSGIDSVRYGMAYLPKVSDEREYLALFAAAGDAPYRGEASTSYLTDAAAPDAIARACPDAYLVAVLRDPVERAYSHYLNNVREGYEHRPFLDALAEERRAGSVPWHLGYLAGGRYADGMRAYRELFGERFRALVYERAFEDLDATLGGLYDWLGLDPDAAAAPARERHNAFSLPRNRLATTLFHSDVARTTAHALVPSRVRQAARRLALAPRPKPALPDGARELVAEAVQHDRAQLESLLGEDPWS